jgi:hypothetical protein
VFDFNWVLKQRNLIPVTGDHADSIPFYRGQFMKEGLTIKDFLSSVYDKSGQVVSLSSNYESRL